MADEIRVNRPQAAGGQPTSRYEGPASPESAPAKSASKTPWIILGLVVIVIVVLGFLFRDKLFKGSGGTGGATARSAFQAVFLTNGQVYFGRLSNAEGNYATLKDIYYLQVGPAQGSGAATDTPQNISLVKLGQELHGPVDEMHISRAQILFYEDLKIDGSVVKAIENYKAGQK